MIVYKNVAYILRSKSEKIIQEIYKPEKISPKQATIMSEIEIDFIIFRLRLKVV